MIKKVTILLTGILVITGFTLMAIHIDKENTTLGNEQSIEEKYTINNMKDYIKIDSNTSRFIDIDPDDALDMLSQNEEGIYFIGYADCPWCQELAPVLNNILSSEKKVAYYIDVRDKRIDNIEDFFDRLSIIDKNLGERSSNSSVPFVINMKATGEVLTHVGTVPNHNAYENEMNEKQVKELYQILSGIVN